MNETTTSMGSAIKPKPTLISVGSDIKPKPTLISVEKINNGYVLYPQYGNSISKSFVKSLDEIPAIIHNIFVGDESSQDR